MSLDDGALVEDPWLISTEGLFSCQPRDCPAEANESEQPRIAVGLVRNADEKSARASELHPEGTEERQLQRLYRQFLGRRQCPILSIRNNHRRRQTAKAKR